MTTIVLPAAVALPPRERPARDAAATLVRPRRVEPDNGRSAAVVPQRREDSSATDYGTEWRGVVPLRRQDPSATDDHAPGTRDRPSGAPGRSVSSQVRLPIIWTGNLSATVDPARLAGPAAGWIGPNDALPVTPPGPPPWRLADTAVRAVIYWHCLVHGDQYDIYRWVNLDALAGIWPHLALPVGVASDWQRVLAAAGLTPPG